MNVNTLALILSEPKEFKICEGCDSILFKHTVVCPLCMSFRYRYDTDEIIQKAKDSKDHNRKPRIYINDRK